MSDEPKFCKDCKHYRKPVFDLFTRCVVPQGRNLETGKLQRRYPDIERDGDVDGYCGTSGRFWEPKPAPSWWEFWK